MTLSAHSLYQHNTFAQKVSWKPLNQENSPLTNMNLKSIEGSLEFHLSVLSRFLYATLIVLGSIFIMFATYELLSYHFQATFMAITVGYILFGLGLYKFSKQNIPLVFDKKKNLYFKELESNQKKDETSLNNIHALQLISSNDKEKVKAELNLVLKDGKRVHVCSYENSENLHEKIQEDANKIADYINKPVWNALSHSQTAKIINNNSSKRYAVSA